ncbi:unnamed protein product, partial [Heterobilharzia americana]
KKEEFYRQLQSTLDKTSVGDIKIVMGDMHAKLEADNTESELIMGREALGEMNENGELFAEFCSFNSLVNGGEAVCSRTRISKKRRGFQQTSGHTTLKIGLTSSQSEESGDGDAAYLRQDQEEEQM